MRTYRIRIIFQDRDTINRKRATSKQFVSMSPGVGTLVRLYGLKYQRNTAGIIDRPPSRGVRDNLNEPPQKSTAMLEAFFNF